MRTGAHCPRRLEVRSRWQMGLHVYSMPGMPCTYAQRCVVEQGSCASDVTDRLMCRACPSRQPLDLLAEGCYL